MPKKFKPPRGMEDFLPREKILRQQILEIVKNTFEKYGFVPLETPALEGWEILSAKGGGGPEVLKETYNFEDKGGRRIGLRFDLTVPLARVIANNPQLPLPFKRYQIGRVWRYGDVTKGRRREFYQADVDTIGSESILADAECIACAAEAISKLGFKEFKVRINNRKLLSAMMRYAGVKEEKIMDAFRAIDKLKKIGERGVKQELKERGISENAARKIMNIIKIKGRPNEVIREAKGLIGNLAEGEEGVRELMRLVSYLKILRAKRFEIDFSLARGLDYYTGPIFELFAAKGIGSIAGGGRYDKLIGLFSGIDLPATGISLGIERIVQVIKDRKMIEPKKTKVKIFVANVSKAVIDDALKITQLLRKEGINTEVNLRERSLGKQFNYVDSQGIPYIVIVGSKDLKKNQVTLRNMKTGKEEKVKLKGLSAMLLK